MQTGTLTRNEMEFRCAGMSYAAQLDESKDEEELGRHAMFAHSGREGEVARGFTVLLARATR
jgi:magnesium-transporting ATPase (P-type)